MLYRIKEIIIYHIIIIIIIVIIVIVIIIILLFFLRLGSCWSTVSTLSQSEGRLYLTALGLVLKHISKEPWRTEQEFNLCWNSNLLKVLGKVLGNHA